MPPKKNKAKAAKANGAGKKASSVAKKTTPKATVEDGDALSDPRFSVVSSDPKFVRISEEQAKITVDSRFAGMFTDPRFSETAVLDKRGRPGAKSSSAHLKEFYRVDEDGSGEGTADEAPRPPEPKKAKKELRKRKKKKAVGAKEEESDDEPIRIDLARGEGNVSSSSSESSSDSDDWDIGEGEGGSVPWGELDAEAPTSEEPPTRRLAVCNLNWDRIRAQDLFVLFNSFKPPAASLKSLRIYPSEFGKTRLATEELSGPAELVAEKAAAAESGDEDEDAKEREERRQRERIRAYQLQRLRYFFAVLECDEAETAAAVYDACNGVEYESSAEKIDLRFIPDDMEFDESEAKEVAEDLGSMEKYEPSQYASSALAQTAVELTWDESDPRRALKLRKAFVATDEKALDEISEFIASGSSSSEDEGGLGAYADILASKDSAKPQFSKGKFPVEVEEEGLSMQWHEGDSDGSEKPKPSRKEKQRPWDAYLERRKDKKREHKASIKAKRATQRAIVRGEAPVEDNDEKADKDADVEANSELALLVSGAKGGKNFNLKKLLKGGKGAEEEFQADLADPRFAGMYDSHHFNIDPSDASYKATPVMEKLLEAKLTRPKKSAKKAAQSEEPLPAKGQVASTDWGSTAAKLKAKARLLEKKQKKRGREIT